MINVKKPALLNNRLAETEILYPSKGSLKLNMTGISEVTLTLGDQSEPIPMHAWVKVYNHLGFVGIFRRTSRDNNVTVEKTYTLRHGIDILQDSVWAAQTEFAGTKAEFLTQLLNQQTQLIQGPNDASPRKPWVVGSCADTSSYTKKINYDNLLSLFNELANESSNYYFTYDQSVWPWTVSLVEKPSAVAGEFRLSRNLEKCKIKDDDADLCTRLILSINKMVDDNQMAGDTGVDVKQNSTVVKTYNNTAAQNAGYGVIVKTADIDVTQDVFPNGPFPEADAWAADFLARRANPRLQVQIDGYVLKGITGESWDESRIGTICRVSLSEYPAPIDERVVSVQYPDLYGMPDRVSVSLANALPALTNSIKATQKAVAQQARSSRSSARESKDFQQHFKITDAAGKVLKQAGMRLNADGLLVYADDEEDMVGARFNVQANKIGMVVGYDEESGENYIKAAEISLEINKDGSTARINANRIIIGDSGSTTTLNSVMTLDGTYAKIIKPLYVGASANDRTTINGGRITASHYDTTYGGDINLYKSDGTGPWTINYATMAGLVAGAEIDAHSYLNIIKGSGYKIECHVDVANNQLIFKDTENNRTITFSKATTLSEAWSSGRFPLTINATQTNGSTTTTVDSKTVGFTNASDIYITVEKNGDPVPYGASQKKINVPYKIVHHGGEIIGNQDRYTDSLVAVDATSVYNNVTVDRVALSDTFSKLSEGSDAQRVDCRTSVYMQGTASNGNKKDDAQIVLSTDTYASGRHCVILRGQAKNGNSYENSVIIGRIDTENVYDAGRLAVSLNDPVLNPLPSSSPSSNSFSMTVSTSGTGRETELQKSRTFYLYQDSTWTDKAKNVYVNVNDVSTATNRLAYVNVDATSIYEDGWKAAYNTINGQTYTVDGVTYSYFPTAVVAVANRKNYIKTARVRSIVDGAKVDRVYCITDHPSDNNMCVLRYNVDGNFNSGNIVAAYPHNKYTAGYTAGSPINGESATLGSNITGTIYDITVKRNDNTTVGQIIDLTNAYADARVGYTANTSLENPYGINATAYGECKRGNIYANGKSTEFHLDVADYFPTSSSSATGKCIYLRFVDSTQTSVTIGRIADTNLKAENVKSGVTIFGVTGSNSGLNVSSVETYSAYGISDGKGHTNNKGSGSAGYYVSNGVAGIVVECRLKDANGNVVSTLYDYLTASPTALYTPSWGTASIQEYGSSDPGSSYTQIGSAISHNVTWIGFQVVANGTAKKYKIKLT